MKASLRAVLLVLWVGVMCPIIYAAFKLKKFSLRDRLLQIGARGMLIILGIKVTVNGELSGQRPLLLVTNHLSYLDIPLLASCCDVRFTPKSEIARWPVLGGLCRAAQSVFIDRRVEKVAKMKSELKAALERGEAVCLFPEATTGSGLHLQPFKSGFFSLAGETFEHGELQVQPAAICYRTISGLPIDRSQWPVIAWYGDMELVPHLWQLLHVPSITAEVTFLPPITGMGRKELALQCQGLISQVIEKTRQRPHPLMATTAAFQPVKLRQK